MRACMGQQAQTAIRALRQAIPYLARWTRPSAGTWRALLSLGDDVWTLFGAFAFHDFPSHTTDAAGADSRSTSRSWPVRRSGSSGHRARESRRWCRFCCGLRAPAAGRYLVNGVPADQFTPEDWHTRFAYVPQEPRLLHASVTDNIRFFRDLDDAAIERAARLAGHPRGHHPLVGRL